MSEHSRWEMSPKRIFKNILLNKVYFPNSANRYILNPILNILVTTVYSHLEDTSTMQAPSKNNVYILCTRKPMYCMKPKQSQKEWHRPPNISRCTTGINGTGINDTGSKFTTGVNDRYRWQTMEQFSNYWQLKMNLKKKMYLYANSTTQMCPKEIMKTFLIEDFFHLPPVSTTPVVHLELRLSPQIFEKLEMALMV